MSVISLMACRNCARLRIIKSKLFDTQIGWEWPEKYGSAVPQLAIRSFRLANTDWWFWRHFWELSVIMGALCVCPKEGNAYLYKCVSSTEKIHCFGSGLYQTIYIFHKEFECIIKMYGSVNFSLFIESETFMVWCLMAHYRYNKIFKTKDFGSASRINFHPGASRNLTWYYTFLLIS